MYFSHCFIIHSLFLSFDYSVYWIILPILRTENETLELKLALFSHYGFISFCHNCWTKNKDLAFMKSMIISVHL